MKHVVIGSGAAGITAVKTIRSLKPNDEILLISEDKQVISRCMLHKYINGKRTADALSFVPEDFFEVNQIQWRSGVTVTSVDTSAMTVKCGEEVINYDKLLIAAGSTSMIPPIGALQTAKNVFCLRNFYDAENIRASAMQAGRIVVIGAGLVGLDAAYALLEMKKEVTVIEMAQRILSLNLDTRAAAAYQTRFESAGCKFQLKATVTNTITDNTGNVTHVILENGTKLPCDFLVVATGVRPKADFLKDSGITYDKAIIVNEHMATNCPNVYAAGDITGLSSNWPNAMRQGEVAARNMCGDLKVYEDTFSAKNTINFFGLVTLSLGKLRPCEGDVVKRCEDRRVYQKYIMHEGRVVGVILQGDISYSGFWQYLVKNGIRSETLNKPAWNVSFADFCAFDEKGEYRWAVS